MCPNPAYGSAACKASDVKDSPVCTTENMLIDHSKDITSMGQEPPWYIKDYTTLILSIYLFLLFINTLAFNRHLFHKRLPDEKDPKDIIQRIIVKMDGVGEVQHEKIIDTGIDRSRTEGNQAVYSGDGQESVNHRVESAVKSQQEGGVEDSVESYAKPSRPEARSRFKRG
jgi:hypothetical protein